MIKSNAKHIVLAVIFLATHDAFAGNLQTLKPEEIHKLLSAKDAQFDNIQLDYLRSGNIITTPFPSHKFPGIAKEHGWENEKSREVPFKYKETLIARGTEATFVREPAPDFHLPEGASNVLMPFQKWSNRYDLAREITKMGEAGVKGFGVLEIRSGGLPVDISQEDAMAIEFSHGVGFGRRITKIESVEQTPDGLRLTGSIKLWWEDESQFDLILDESLVVRKATIQSNVKGNITKFEISTDGLADEETIPLAKRGDFVRTRLGLLNNGEIQGTPKVQEKFSTEFLSLQTQLTDAEYEKLTDMTPELGMQIEDHISGKTFFIGGEESLEVREAISKSMSGIEDMKNISDTEALNSNSMRIAHDGQQNDKTSQLPSKQQSNQESSAVATKWWLFGVGLIMLLFGAVIWFRNILRNRKSYMERS